MTVYDTPGHYAFWFKIHYVLKLTAFSGFFCFDTIVLTEYYSPGWSFPQEVLSENDLA